MAINLMNNSRGSFIYVTPLIKELETRILPEVKFISEPKQVNGSKLEGLKELLALGYNVATTHALLGMFDDEVIDLLNKSDYTLILDEVANVVENMHCSKKDLEMLLHHNYIKVENGEVLAGDKAEDYLSDKDAKLYEIVYLAKRRRLLIYGETILIWRLPIDIFNSFSKVYVLTYMFDCQLQRLYYDMYGIKYKYYHIRRGRLVEGADTRVIDKSLINIYEGKLNNIKMSLSSNWYSKKATASDIAVLNRRKANYFKNVTKSSTKHAMWTCFKANSKSLEDKNYTIENSYVYSSARATNDYKDRINLAYMINKYADPTIVNFFKERGITVDQDKYSLSELLQWVYRARIRDDKNINIYLPSERMRNLLYGWLNREGEVFKRGEAIDYVEDWDALLQLEEE